jgi:hypothetical protein
VVNRTVSAIWEGTPFDWPTSISGGGPFRWKDPQPDVVSHIAHQSAAPAPPRDTTTTHCGCMRSADLPPGCIRISAADAVGAARPPRRMLPRRQEA